MARFDDSRRTPETSIKRTIQLTITQCDGNNHGKTTSSGEREERCEAPAPAAHLAQRRLKAAGRRSKGIVRVCNIPREFARTAPSQSQHDRRLKQQPAALQKTQTQLHFQAILVRASQSSGFQSLPGAVLLPLSRLRSLLDEEKARSREMGAIPRACRMRVRCIYSSSARCLRLVGFKRHLS